MSDKTPWLDLENDGVGWVVRLNDKAGFIEKIEQLASKSFEQRLVLREKVFDGARRRILDPQHVDRNRRMFAELCKTVDRF